MTRASVDPGHHCDDQAMMTRASVDQGTTEGETCGSLLLHAFHNAEPFSKFAFLGGKYAELDLGNLSLAAGRDYATYLALRSAHQGRNAEVRTAPGMENSIIYYRATISKLGAGDKAGHQGRWKLGAFL